MPVNDSGIAATVMALGVPVVTQDDDFPRLAELEVVHVQAQLADGPPARRPLAG